MKEDLDKIKSEIDSLLEDLFKFKNNFIADYKKLVSKYTKITSNGKLKDEQ